MKLKIYPSDKGDCLLLRGADNRLMLIDGGMSNSYKAHVANELGKLRLQEKEERLDVVYISHIDEDHISGVLQLLNDEVLWIEHKYQLAHNNPDHKQPERLRPPRVRNIWHNAFQAQVEENAGAIEEMLAASAAILSGVDATVLANSSDVERDVARVRALASEQAALVTGVRQAVQVSNRISAGQLNIKLNAPARRKLMMLRKPPARPKPFKLGGMDIHIIGPTEESLEKLRKFWNDWLTKNMKAMKEVKEQAEKDAKRFEEFGASSDVLAPKVRQAGELVNLLTLSEPDPGELGRPKSVTPPNIASLMLLVEEKGKTLLLTGDGRHEEITEGLKRVGKLKEGGGLHVNVLKVQHHGSENNISKEFCRTVTADHYLFCGLNGGNDGNPNVEVVKAVAESRLSPDTDLRSANPQAGDPFTFHFSGNVATALGNDKTHMKQVATAVNKLVKQGGGQMSVRYLELPSLDLDI